jgi:hypothetical protein
MTRLEFERLTSQTQEEHEAEVDQTLEHVDNIEGVLRRPQQQPTGDAASAAATADFPMIHTAKAERRLRERLEREGVGEDDAGDAALSPEDKRALDAERRAAWRKARLRSLENVIRHISVLRSTEN